jgi:hypothetical protein
MNTKTKPTEPIKVATPEPVEVKPEKVEVAPEPVIESNEKKAMRALFAKYAIQNPTKYEAKKTGFEKQLNDIK